MQVLRISNEEDEMGESGYELSIEEMIIVRVYAAGALTATEAAELLAIFRSGS